MAGRPADWLIKKCQTLVDKRELVEFLADVASGKDMEQVVTDGGETIRVPASVKDRIRATEILLNRGFGKEPATEQTPEQSVMNAIKAQEIVKEMERRFSEVHS